jgi:hypothetical protein
MVDLRRLRALLDRIGAETTALRRLAAMTDDELAADPAPDAHGAALTAGRAAHTAYSGSPGPGGVRSWPRTCPNPPDSAK